eukprot:s909_g18.t1
MVLTGDTPSNWGISLWYGEIYPLSSLEPRNNSYIVEKLLMFGAKPWVKTWPWGQSPYSYAERHAKTHQAILEIFKKAGCSPTSPVWSCQNKFHSTPPPLGFEEFFANVEQNDPLVVVGSSELAWLHETGPRHRRNR